MLRTEQHDGLTFSIPPFSMVMWADLSITALGGKRHAALQWPRIWLRSQDTFVTS